jgi:ATP-dependent helicase HrpB
VAFCAKFPFVRYTALPIDDALPALRDALASGTRAVLQAPPGAGKTTRVPPALLDAAWLAGGRIVMLEPRRLAARAAAHRMSAELGESVGGTVGYRVRGDSRVSARTRIEVVTEGVLTRIIQDDPSLEGIGLLIFDEFHERNLVADLGLALALQSAELVRPDLRILVMSATLDGAAVSSLLGDAPIITSEGRAFPVETRWVSRRDNQRIEGAVTAVIDRALRDDEGDILVFLPGAAEIRRVASQLAQRALPPRTTVFQLMGAMPLEEQDRAIAPSPSGTRKVVLSTSVAETSLTIEGVGVVIDCGLARVPRFSPSSGMARLETVRVSQDAAEQRHGRAGRVAEGVCYRLWDAAEQMQLLAHRTPEILDADLAPLALELAAAGISDPASLRWLTPPPAGAYAQARELLTILGALDATGRLTSHGARMAEAGLHPRLAHLVLRGEAMGHGALAVDLAALLAERDLVRHDGNSPDVDVRTRVEILRAPGSANDPRADRARVFQLRDETKRLRRERRIADAAPDLDQIGALVALAYPDRVALARGARGRFLMRNGRGARVNDAAALAGAAAIAVAETDGATGESRVFLATAIDPATIAVLFADDIRGEETVELDDSSGIVRALVREMLGALVISEKVVERTDASLVANALLAAIRRDGIASLPWSDGAKRTRQRLAFAHSADSGWPSVSDDTLISSLDDWLAPSLDGITRKSGLAKLDLGGLLLDRLDWKQRAALDAFAPTHIEVPTGSRIPIDYSDPEAPVLAVRLQEMFGATQTPRIAEGRVPLTLHLLSPAHRPVQVTRDLSGFWTGSYFEVRKEMRGRYPKHYWPENPLEAEPTRRAKPRGT